MKLLKSECEKAWLFQAKVEDDHLLAGLACFQANCPAEVVFVVKGRKLIAAPPHRAINNPMPCRAANVRLALLP